MTTTDLINQWHLRYNKDSFYITKKQADYLFGLWAKENRCYTQQKSIGGDLDNVNTPWCAHRAPNKCAIVKIGQYI